MKRILLYTDGACSGNPGKGGWACILFYGEHRRELSGGEAETTNNRMELTAVIEGLRALKESCEVDVYSDSAYVVNAFSEHWIDNWVRHGFQKVKNVDLWHDLIGLTKMHRVHFHKVKGHADDENNNRCDQLARAEIKKLQE